MADQPTASSLTRTMAALAVAAAMCLLAGGREADAQSVAVLTPPSGVAREAWLALEQGRARDAADGFERAIAAGGNDAMLHVGAALAARQLGQLTRARESLVRALQIDPALTPASLVLGTLRYEAGDLDGAIQAYEAALVRAPGQAEIQSRLDEWTKEHALHGGFLQAQGSHFTVLFDGPAVEELAQRAVVILEGAYLATGAALQRYPLEPVTVVLYTQQRFRDITRSPEWSAGMFDGRIRVPVRGALDAPGELERVLTHEFAHAVVRGVAPRGVPAWLNEGLAVVLEAHGLEGARRDARAARMPIPLDRLRESFAGLSPADVTLAYAESALAVQAIIERAGAPALMDLLSDLASGASFDAAFNARIQVPYSDFLGELNRLNR